MCPQKNIHPLKAYLCTQQLTSSGDSIANAVNASGRKNVLKTAMDVSAHHSASAASASASAGGNVGASVAAAPTDPYQHFLQTIDSLSDDTRGP